MKTLFITLSLVLIALGAVAQGNDVIVYRKSGDVFVGKGQQWEKVLLYKKCRVGTDVKLVGKNSSCLVTSAKGDTILTSHEANEIVTLGKVGVHNHKSHNIFMAILHDPLVEGEPALHRGYNLMLFPADNEVLSGRSFDFTWGKDGNHTYKFSLLENAGTNKWLCKNTEVNGEQLSSNAGCSSAAGYYAGKKYSWNVRPAFNNDSTVYFLSFSIADAAYVEKVNRDIKTIGQSEGDEFYVLNKAGIYYKNRMYTEAYRTLATASEKYPESVLIKAAQQKLIDNISEINKDRLK